MNKLNRFAEWQSQNVTKRESLIREFLEQCKRSRANYPHITALADAAATYITKIEGKPKPCSKTTILRNLQYKSLLTHYLANQRGAKFVSPNSLPDDRAKSIVTGLQLQAYNLKQENERLQYYIETIDNELETFKISSIPRLAAPTLIARVETGTQILQLQNDFGRVCKTLWLILEHYSDVVFADANMERILDKSASSRGGKNIVVQSDNAAPYFDWLRSNSGFAD